MSDEPILAAITALRADLGGQIDEMTDLRVDLIFRLEGRDTGAAMRTEEVVAAPGFGASLDMPGAPRCARRSDPRVGLRAASSMLLRGEGARVPYRVRSHSARAIFARQFWRRQAAKSGEHSPPFVAVARLDRMQDGITDIRDDIAVNFGTAAAARRAPNDNTRDEVRARHDLITTMQRQIQRLQTQVRELRGEA